MREQIEQEVVFENGRGFILNKESPPLFSGKAEKQEIQKKDIICFRCGLDFMRQVVDKAMFLSEYITGLKFPSSQGDSNRKRMLQINYDTFISTMAELIQKYRDI